jgi:hypothetical protein
MFTFAVRPGHGSKELLLEFRKGTGSDEMVAAMKEVLTKANVEVIRKRDLWENDEIIYYMDSDFGEFELSSNNYGCIFIMAPKNQAAIVKLGEAFDSVAPFEREEVDFAKYT